MPPSSSKYRAVVFGSTGACGKSVVKHLLKSPICEHVSVVTRRPLPSSIKQNDKENKLEEILVDLNQMNREANRIGSNDVGFCCLGTTIRKAGSQEAFKRVDNDYAIEGAKLAKAGGCAHWQIITAIGANPNSMFFYNQVKGEIERDLSLLEFPRLTIYRPSLLLATRPEFRFAEWAGQYVSYIFNWLLWGPARKFRSIHVDDVGKAMVKHVDETWEQTKNHQKEENSIKEIFESDQIQDMVY